LFRSQLIRHTLGVSLFLALGLFKGISLLLF